MFDLDFPRAFPALAASADFRSTPEDFCVEEQLGFALADNGEHLCLHIEKRGQNTVWVAKQLAELANIKQMDVGYCGLKDRHAVTRQWFSVYLGFDKAVGRNREIDAQTIQIEGCNILACTRHNKKLRPGTHAANQFTIRLRNVQGEREQLRQRFDDISAQGVPNYFGEQRFGFQGANLQQARALEGQPTAVWRQRKNQFALSAVRSWLFNRVLAAHIANGTWRTSIAGEPLPEASAPLWGRGRLSSTEALLAFEQETLAELTAWRDVLEHVGLQQERRVLRLRPTNTQQQWEGDSWTIQFQLPPGTYATSVLRELLTVNNRALAAESPQPN